MTTPSSPTRLIVLRGNSASGKSAVATGLRERYGRGIALVRQDVLRREVLRERDLPGGANIGLIDLTVRHATKPIADEVTEEQLRRWYTPLDLLPGGVESVVPATSPLEATVDRVLHESGLRASPCAHVRPLSARTPAP
ncbi:hypothetical protein ABTY96_05000 [Streptomyces sp. NPDC096057]|uniref:hypothetical protein n=1 Tax=Streptomyces sp. NPDC096057 TaxID=3155543 RepID=UPI00332191BF